MDLTHVDVELVFSGTTTLSSGRLRWSSIGKRSCCILNGSNQLGAQCFLEKVFLLFFIFESWDGLIDQTWCDERLGKLFGILFLYRNSIVNFLNQIGGFLIFLLKHLTWLNGALNLLLPNFELYWSSLMQRLLFQSEVCSENRRLWQRLKRKVSLNAII